MTRSMPGPSTTAQREEDRRPRRRRVRLIASRHLRDRWTRRVRARWQGLRDGDRDGQRPTGAVPPFLRELAARRARTVAEVRLALARATEPQRTELAGVRGQLAQAQTAVVQSRLELELLAPGPGPEQLNRRRGGEEFVSEHTVTTRRRAEYDRAVARLQADVDRGQALVAALDRRQGELLDELSHWDTTAAATTAVVENVHDVLLGSYHRGLARTSSSAAAALPATLDDLGR